MSKKVMFFISKKMIIFISKKMIKKCQILTNCRVFDTFLMKKARRAYICARFFIKMSKKWCFLIKSVFWQGNRSFSR